MRVSLSGTFHSLNVECLFLLLCLVRACSPFRYQLLCPVLGSLSHLPDEVLPSPLPLSFYTAERSLTMWPALSEFLVGDHLVLGPQQVLAEVLSLISQRCHLRKLRPRSTEDRSSLCKEMALSPPRTEPAFPLLLWTGTHSPGWL